MVLFIIPGLLILSIVLSGLYLLNKKGSKGGLQVTSIPKSKVYLNRVLIGETPICKCEAQDRIATGEYNLKLIPLQEDLPPFEQKITIDKQVLTVVDRTFAKGASSEGSFINLSRVADKNIELQVISMPADAEVLLDENPIGKTPLIKSGITESDHEIKLIKDGYREKTVRIRTAEGFRLTAVVYLGIAPISSESAKTESVATPSAALLPQVVIASQLGYVNVRDINSTSGKLLQTVNSGEVYDLIDESDGWFKIKLADGKSGWISSSYAQKK